MQITFTYTVNDDEEFYAALRDYFGDDDGNMTEEQLIQAVEKAGKQKLADIVKSYRRQQAIRAALDGMPSSSEPVS